MFVILNGERLQVPPQATVMNVLELMARDGGQPYPANGRGVAVAVEGEVVPRHDWSATRLGEGERVEVLAAIQGGSA